jgi:hypothetical protein
MTLKEHIESHSLVPFRSNDGVEFTLQYVSYKQDDGVVVDERTHVSKPTLGSFDTMSEENHIANLDRLVIEQIIELANKNEMLMPLGINFVDAVRFALEKSVKSESKENFCLVPESFDGEVPEDVLVVRTNLLTDYAIVGKKQLSDEVGVLLVYNANNITAEGERNYSAVPVGFYPQSRYVKVTI